jgi:hypothetical protein
MTVPPPPKCSSPVKFRAHPGEQSRQATRSSEIPLSMFAQALQDPGALRPAATVRGRLRGLTVARAGLIETRFDTRFSL